MSMFKNSRGTQSRDSPFLPCRSGIRHAEQRREKSVTLGAVGTFEKQTRKRLDCPWSIAHRDSSVSTLHTPQTLHLIFYKRKAVFTVSVNPIISPPLSSSSLLVFLCPSHPPVLTPELSPLKSPGNKLWCLSSSLLSRSPHPSSQSADTSAIKVGSVQKAQPLRSVQYKHVSL